MDSFQFDVIYTLNAQGNVMLSVMTEAFRLTDNQVFNEIQRSAAELRAVLESKGIHYKDMKRALVPNTDRLERAFVFDWTKFDTGRYGQEANEMLLPLLERRSSRSVLLGDWASKYRFNRIYEASFGANINPKIAEAARLADTLYFVYLNNLTPAAVARIDLSLAKHPAYAGNVDLTYTTPIKAFLSTMLVKAYIQHRSTIISTHEDDRPSTEDYNILMYDFEGAGYTVRSVPSWLYGLFLSYKIERPMLPARDEDRRFSLNAMTPTPTPLEDCEVELDEPKLDYLQREKSGSLRKAELHTLSAADIAEQVRDKLTSNYVYNLARTTDDQILKFNVVLENPGVARYLCALEYMPEQRKLRIITLF